MATSDDFKKNLKAGNLTEAIKMALSEAIELEITTWVVPADASDVNAEEPQPGYRMRTRINIVEGDIENEIGSQFVGSGPYAELRDFHMEQVKNGRETIRQNLQGLQKLFGLLINTVQGDLNPAPTSLSATSTSQILTAEEVSVEPAEEPIQVFTPDFSVQDTFAVSNTDNSVFDPVAEVGERSQPTWVSELPDSPEPNSLAPALDLKSELLEPDALKLNPLEPEALDLNSLELKSAEIKSAELKSEQEQPEQLDQAELSPSPVPSADDLLDIFGSEAMPTPSSELAPVSIETSDFTVNADGFIPTPVLDPAVEPLPTKTSAPPEEDILPIESSSLLLDTLTGVEVPLEESLTAPLMDLGLHPDLDILVPDINSMDLSGLNEVTAPPSDLSPSLEESLEALPIISLGKAPDEASISLEPSLSSNIDISIFDTSEPKLEVLGLEEPGSLQFEPRVEDVEASLLSWEEPQEPLTSPDFESIESEADLDLGFSLEEPEPVETAPEEENLDLIFTSETAELVETDPENILPDFSLEPPESLGDLPIVEAPAELIDLNKLLDESDPGRAAFAIAAASPIETPILIQADPEEAPEPSVVPPAFSLSQAELDSTDLSDLLGDDDAEWVKSIATVPPSEPPVFIQADEPALEPPIEPPAVTLLGAEVEPIADLDQWLDEAGGETFLATAVPSEKRLETPVLIQVDPNQAPTPSVQIPPFTLSESELEPTDLSSFFDEERADSPLAELDRAEAPKELITFASDPWDEPSTFTLEAAEPESAELLALRSEAAESGSIDLNDLFDEEQANSPLLELELTEEAATDESEVLIDDPDFTLPDFTLEDSLSDKTTLPIQTTPSIQETLSDFWEEPSLETTPSLELSTPGIDLDNEMDLSKWLMEDNSEDGELLPTLEPNLGGEPIESPLLFENESFTLEETSLANSPAEIEDALANLFTQPESEASQLFPDLSETIPLAEENSILLESMENPPAEDALWHLPKPAPVAEISTNSDDPESGLQLSEEFLTSLFTDSFTKEPQELAGFGLLDATEELKLDLDSPSFSLEVGSVVSEVEVEESLASLFTESTPVKSGSFPDLSSVAEETPLNPPAVEAALASLFSEPASENTENDLADLVLSDPAPSPESDFLGMQPPLATEVEASLAALFDEPSAEEASPDLSLSKASPSLDVDMGQLFATNQPGKKPSFLSFEEEPSVEESLAVLFGEPESQEPPTLRTPPETNTDIGIEASLAALFSDSTLPTAKPSSENAEEEEKNPFADFKLTELDSATSSNAQSAPSASPPVPKFTL